MESLNPQQKSALEKEYRATQSKTVLNMYDKTQSEKIKDNYQAQIRLYAQEKIQTKEEVSLQKSEKPIQVEGHVHKQAISEKTKTQTIEVRR